MTRPGRAGAVMVSLGLLAGTLGACTGGSGGDPGAGGATTTTGAPSPLVQEALLRDIAPLVLAEVVRGVDGRFELRQDEAQIFDPSLGELEFSSDEQRARFEFMEAHAFLGFFGVVMETADGAEFWELTVEVFRDEDGARETFRSHGSPGGGAVSNSELIGSESRDYGAGRVGSIVVDRFAFRAAAEGQVHDQGEFLELRGSLVDDNVLLNVLAIVDADGPEAADPFAAVQRALGAVDGKHRAYYDVATRSRS